MFKVPGKTASENFKMRKLSFKLRSKYRRDGGEVSSMMFDIGIASPSTIGWLGLSFMSRTVPKSMRINVSFTVLARFGAILRALRSRSSCNWRVTTPVSLMSGSPPSTNICESTTIPDSTMLEFCEFWMVIPWNMIVSGLTTSSNVRFRTPVLKSKSKETNLGPVVSGMKLRTCVGGIPGGRCP